MSNIATIGIAVFILVVFIVVSNLIDQNKSKEKAPETTQATESTWSEEAVSFFEPVTSSSIGQAFQENFGSNANLVFWTLVGLIVLLVLIAVINIFTKKSISTSLPILGIVALLVFIFISFFKTGDTDKVGSPNFVIVDLKQVNIGQSIVVVMDFATTAKVHLPTTRIADGKTINAVCGEIIEPSHILGHEKIPKIHVSSITTTSGGIRDFEVPQKMREFLGSVGVSKVKVKYTRIRSTIYRTSAEDCSHS